MHPSPEQLALLALGETDALTPAERRHVEECLACMAEVADLARVVAVGRNESGSTELLTPPPHVWDRVLAEVSSGPPTQVGADDPTWPTAVDHSNPPVSPLTPTVVSLPSPPRRRRRRWAPVAAAAALALVVGGAVGYGVGRARQPGMTVLAQAQLAATPSWAGSSADAELRRNAEGQRILTLDLQASRPLSGIQAVWLIDPDRPSDPMPVGQLDLGKGIWSVAAGVDLSQYRIIDVSEEPADDTDPRHSGNSIVRGSLQ